jgi:cobalt-zinc-cadmium efflux system outer membrane protein
LVAPPFAILVCLALGPEGAAEVPTSARTVSFAEARALADEHAADLAVAARRIDVARADVKIAGAFANPSLTAHTTRETSELSLGLSIPLPLFGQRATAIRAANADLEVAGLDAQVVRADVRWGVTIAWVDLWEAQARARVVSEAAKEAERLFVASRERFDAGTAPKLDLVRAQADLARATSEAKSASLQVSAAAAHLTPWLGVEDTVPLRARADAGFPDGLSPAEDLLQRMISHPVLARDRAQTTAAEAHVRAEERARWPIVQGELTIDYRDRSNEFLTDVLGGAAFELPVLNLRGGAIARARAQQAVAEAQVALDTRRLVADLRDAFARTEGAKVRWTTLAKEVLPSMEEALRMTQEGYHSGRLDLLRVLDAERAVLENRLAHAEALAAYARAYADLERAVGHKLDAGGAGAR